MRRTIRLIHLVLGLAAGLLLSIVTVSGAAVVFRDDLDWLHAERREPAAAGGAALDATAAALRERWPGVRVTRLLTPEATGRGHEWWLRDDKGTRETADDESWKAFTDAASGEPLGDTRGSSVSAALAWLARFHHNLWLGEVGGILVGVSGLAMLGFIATGLWLWWPGLKRFATGFRMRWSKGGLARNWDLHNWSGIIGTAPLLVIALTGAMFEFRWMRAAVHYGLGGGEADRPMALRPRPAPPQQQPDGAAQPRGEQERPQAGAEERPQRGGEAGERRPRGGGGRGGLGFDRAVAAAEAAADGVARVVMPPRAGRGDAPWTVILDYPGNVGSFSGVVVQVGQDGAAGLVLDPRTMSPGGWINGQQWGLHTGTWGGGWSKALYLIAGLLPPVLLFTGLAMWWQRRAQKTTRTIAA